jgi:hypothetical protein
MSERFTFMSPPEELGTAPPESLPDMLHPHSARLAMVAMRGIFISTSPTLKRLKNALCEAKFQASLSFYSRPTKRVFKSPVS